MGDVVVDAVTLRQIFTCDDGTPFEKMWEIKALAFVVLTFILLAVIWEANSYREVNMAIPVMERDRFHKQNCFPSPGWGHHVICKSMTKNINERAERKRKLMKLWNVLIGRGLYTYKMVPDAVTGTTWIRVDE